MLSQLGTLCPQLQVLRYGGDAAANSALTRALPGLLPSVVQPAAPDQLGESWEEAEDSMLCGMLVLAPCQHVIAVPWQFLCICNAGSSTACSCAARK